MVRLIPVLFVVLALFSCKSEKSGIAKIDELFASFEKSPSPESATVLQTEIETYIAENQNDTTGNAALLMRLAMANEKLNRPNEAVQNLRRGLKDFYNTENGAEMALALAALYDKKLQKPTQKTLILQAAREAFTGNEKITEAAKALPPDLPSIHERMSSMGKMVFNDTLQRFNEKIATDFVTACENIALVLPQDSMSAAYLIDASTIARNLGSIPKVLELFQWVYTKFPNHPKAADAMFLEAFTYDSDLKDLEKAKQGYESYLAKYPDDDFSDDAKVMLKNLGKSDDEILKELESQ